MAQTKLSPRKKQAIFRYTQYALLAVIAIIALAMADWNTLTKQVFNLDIAAKQFPRHHYRRAEKYAHLHGARLRCGPLRRAAAGAHAYLVHRTLPVARHPVRRDLPWYSRPAGLLRIRLRHSPGV